MSYVETCNKHGQYHADYICGECFEEQKIRIEELKLALEKAIQSSHDALALSCKRQLENEKLRRKIKQTIESLTSL